MTTAEIITELKLLRQKFNTMEAVMERIQTEYRSEIRANEGTLNVLDRRFVKAFTSVEGKINNVIERIDRKATAENRRRDILLKFIVPIFSALLGACISTLLFYLGLR